MLQKRIRKQTNCKPENKSFEKVRKYWSEEEDQVLKQAVQNHGSNWKLIAEYLLSRNASQCAQRWKRIKPDNEERNQKWTVSEDQQLKKLTKEFKLNWKMIARFLPNRTSRQIRERYINHLDPSINNKAWSQQEDLKVWELYQNIGSRWSEMAKKLKGRPENMIKNRFYGYIRKTYAKQENPYYIIPIKNRKFKEDDKNQEAIKRENENIDERFSDQQQGRYNKIQHKVILQQDDFSQLEINSMSKSIHKEQIAQHVRIHTQECQQFSTSFKYINPSIESEIIKNDYQSQQGEGSINNHNYISYISEKEQKEEENDNFVNEFLNLEFFAGVGKIGRNIFDDINTNSYCGYSLSESEI